MSEQVETVDARGLSCPEPALRARQSMLELGTGTLEVLVDSATSRDNVARTAEQAGWEPSFEEQPDGSFRLTLTR